MPFKLIESAQDRWRAVNAPHISALVRVGAIFINGRLAEPTEPGRTVREDTISQIPPNTGTAPIRRVI